MKRFRDTHSSAPQSSFRRRRVFSNVCFTLAGIGAVVSTLLTTLTFNSLIDAGISVQHSPPPLDNVAIPIIAFIIVFILVFVGGIFRIELRESILLATFSTCFSAIICLLISMAASSIYSATVHNAEEVLSERLKDLGYESVSFNPDTSFERVEEAHENTPGYRKSAYYEQVAYFEKGGKQHYMVVGFDKDKKPFIQSVTEMVDSPTKLVNK